MLPPFIIEQIRRREDQQRRDRQADQPRLELPLEPRSRTPVTNAEPGADDEANRGVVIVDLGA